MPVPKLRFKEFSGEWEEKKLGEIGKVSMCKRIMKDQTSLSGDIPFYKIGTFGKKADAYISKEIYKEYKNKYSFPNKGDILLSASGTIGRTVIYNGEPAYFQDSNIVWIANNEKKVLNSFLFQLYKNIKWTTENTTIARLYNDNLSNMCVYFPVLKEQEKIGNFLSSVDKKISIMEEKLNLFEEYKKGIMQKIFSQKLRFKNENGNDYPKWEEKKLNEVLKIGNGKDYKHLNIGKIPVYGTGGVITKVDDFLYNGESVGIGRKGTINKPIFLTGKFWTVDTLFYTYEFKNSLPKFIYYVFNNIDWLSYNEATGVPSLSKSTILKIVINLPCLEEQKKIADFLSSIDIKIEKISDELENLKEFKKGLLQKMFV